MKKIILFLALMVSIVSCDKFKKDQSGQESPDNVSEQEMNDNADEIKDLTEESEDEIEIPDTELGFMVTLQRQVRRTGKVI